MAGGSKNKAAAIPEIQGKVLQSARQRLKMKPEELGAKACLSKKHIIQLEDGGVSSFYSEAHKVTVAKKVGKLLNLEESQYLVYPDGDQSFQSSLSFDVEALEDEVHEESAITKEISNNPSSKEEKYSSKKNEPVEQKISLENLQSGKKSFIKKIPLQLPVNLAKGALLLLVMAGLYITRADIVELFMDKPAPVAISAEPSEPTQEAIETSATTVAAVGVPPLPSEAGCPKSDATVLEYRVTEATKAADFVFIQSKSKQTICVIDATGKSNMQSMDVGSNYTFTGKAPFTVLTNGISQANIYFQGRPVRVSGDSVRSIKLQEVKFAQ